MKAAFTTCVSCSASLDEQVLGRGRPRLRCEPCARLARDSYHLGRSCLTCGTHLGVGTRTSYCSGCKVSAKRPQPTIERTCPICRVTFTHGRADKVYCSPECRSLKPGGFRRTKKRASAERRGYDKAHREVRTRFIAAYSPVDPCCLCGLPLGANTRSIHLDHNPAGGYRGLAHARCNVRDGALRGGVRGRRTQAEGKRLSV